MIRPLFSDPPQRSHVCCEKKFSLMFRPLLSEAAFRPPRVDYWKRISLPKVVDLSGCPGEEASGKTLLLGLNFHPIPVTSEDQPIAIIEKVKEVSPEIFTSILPVGFYTWIDCCACFRLFAISMVGVGNILLAVEKRMFRSSFRFKFGSETADASQLEQGFHFFSVPIPSSKNRSDSFRVAVVVAVDCCVVGFFVFSGGVFTAPVYSAYNAMNFVDSQ